MYSASHTQYEITKNTPFSVGNATMFHMKALVEMIHTSDDVNVQVQLFTSLSAFMVSNKANIEDIVTCNSLYDKIGNLLSGCPPRQAIVLFNFLLAILYTVDEDCTRQNLIVYAKNMIRSSGCLATMCELFTSSIMHQDAWRSLSRCLAETCRNLERNQSYCTHLIPTCIQRCSQRNIEVLLVLQSLLQDHPKNANLFIECNGIAIFQREFLQHDICLQLLNTVVQSSNQAIELINKTDISQYLRHFLHLYGPKSQLGQWATIILYRVAGPQGTSDMPLLKQQTINVQPVEESVIDQPNLQNISDATRFVQNVMNEIIKCTPKTDMKYVQGLLNAQIIDNQKNCSFSQEPLNNRELHNPMWRRNISSKFNDNWPVQKHFNSHFQNRPNKKPDLSFSFLYKEHNNRLLNIANKKNGTCRINVSKSLDNKVLGITDHTSRHDTPELSSFAPKFSSTPKGQERFEFTNSKTRIQNTTSKLTSNTIGINEMKRRVRSRKYIRKPPKRLEQTTSEKESKHRSISGWFIEAVNESCTTLFKTVKNIFKPKTCLEESKAKCTASVTINSASCSYSFTNYMRKRDAIMETECAKDLSMEMSNCCITCNDTTALREKLGHDEYLKQTVRKLKVGINMYGCDFKKISKQLWPNQTYMTPVVLYNLYRKLIIK